MDHKTYPLSRIQIRKFAEVFRKLFCDCIAQNGIYFDTVKAFEKFPTLFPNVTTEIVEDDELGDIPGRCIPDYQGNYHIQIKQSVYEGASEDEVGGYRTHILHELCHAFLCMAGFTPVHERSFANNELRAFESMEWQAKALAGEILMPYEETANFGLLQLVFECGVSVQGAKNRLKLS